MSDLIYEKCIVANEQKDYNPEHYKKVCNCSERCDVITIPHSELLKYSHEAKYIVRTGAFKPWGNVVLYSGVDASLWFKKKGVKTPNYYEKRVNFKGEKN